LTYDSARKIDKGAKVVLPDDDLNKKEEQKMQKVSIRPGLLLGVVLIFLHRPQ